MPSRRYRRPDREGPDLAGIWIPIIIFILLILLIPLLRPEGEKRRGSLEVPHVQA